VNEEVNIEIDGPAYGDEHVLAYPAEYIAGIDLYNAGEFHAAHDAWEERWMGEVGPEEKLFLQGLIQSAVIFHHLQIGRPGAAREMYRRATEKFARLNRKHFMSLDLEDYQRRLDGALAWLLGVPDPRTAVWQKIEAPQIKLSPGAMEYD
jgi:predicted metal-dependent hydrolase